MGSKRDYKRAVRKANADYITSYKSARGCCICGELRPACLDLHHRDSSTKLFELSLARDMSFEKIDDELRKCDVLCANCHRILHAEELNQDNIKKMENDLPLFNKQ